MPPHLRGKSGSGSGQGHNSGYYDGPPRNKGQYYGECKGSMQWANLCDDLQIAVTVLGIMVVGVVPKGTMVGVVTIMSGGT